VLYLYFVPFIGFQIKYDDDDDGELLKCYFYKPDTLAVAQTTASKHQRGVIM